MRRIHGLFHRHPAIVTAVLFLAVGLAIYSNVILKGIFIFDDFEYVIDNPTIHDLGSIALSDPRQVGYFTFAVNYILHGEDPRGFHAVNVAVHIVTAVLVFLFVRIVVRLLSGGGDEAGERRALAAGFMAGLLFLVHPLQTQAVSYITQRFTSLAALLFVAAVTCYLSARQELEAGGRGTRTKALFAGALLATLLAMRTKEIAFTIPFVIAAFEHLLFPSSSFGKRRYGFLIPFGALLLVIPLSILGPELGLLPRDTGVADVTRQEKIYDLTNRSPVEYALTQTRVVVTYLRLLAFPVKQRVVYDLAASRSLFDLRVLISLAVLGLIAWSGVRFWRRPGLPPSPSRAGRRLVALGILWFFVTASVESSVIPIKDLIFEHRAYLPGIGFFMALSSLVVLVPREGKDGPGYGATVAAGIAVLAVVLAVSTYARNGVWTDELAFWDDVVRKAPDKAIGYHNRGNAHAKLGNVEAALRDMDKTISMFPREADAADRYEQSDFTAVNMAKTYLNRGSVYLMIGEVELAEADFTRSRALVSAPPIDVIGTLELADVYFKRKAYGHAIQEYGKVLQWDPENLEALNNRANAYSWTGKYLSAIMDLSRIIALRPDYALAYHNRGVARAWAGQPKKAADDFRKACDLGFPPACESIERAQRGEK